MERSKDSFITKKQFMSRKDLFEYVIPDGILEIGDWAFADCDNLQMLSFPISVKK